jgi:fermentation-respiration switch protein FrsA (DUF1100 family)
MERTGLFVPLLLLGIGVGGCGDNLFYYPDNVVYSVPTKYGLEYEDVFFSSKDGTVLHGWFIPAKSDPVGTVIHFHGNAQNLTAHFEFVKWLPQEGFNLFVFDYRGYGQSKGKPSRRGIYEDSVAAIEYVKSRSDIDRERLFVLGQSLGGANAISAVAGNHFDGIRGVVIESSFCSYRRIARDVLDETSVSFLQAPISSLMVSNSYDPEDVVADISPIPIVFIHGTDDDVVPCYHSKRLYEKAGEQKELWIIEGGRHTEAFTRFGTEYRQRVVDFYKSCLEDKEAQTTDSLVRAALSARARLVEHGFPCVCTGLHLRRF